MAASFAFAALAAFCCLGATPLTGLSFLSFLTTLPAASLTGLPGAFLAPTVLAAFGAGFLAPLAGAALEPSLPFFGSCLPAGFFASAGFAGFVDLAIEGFLAPLA